jgi:hypothetical protein
MQILITPLVRSRSSSLLLSSQSCCGYKAIVDNDWTNAATATYYALVDVFIVVYLVKLGQETAVVDVLLEHEVVVLRHHSHVSLVVSSCTNRISKAILNIKHKVRIVRVLLHFELCWVVCAGCSLLLQVGLLNNVILVVDKLLVRCIRCCDYNLSST